LQRAQAGGEAGRKWIVSKQILTTRGKWTIVDDEDYEWLQQWKWHCTEKGYVRRVDCSGGKRLLVTMHRLIMDAPDEMQVDHRDGNTLNNCRSNLRLASNSQNCCNKDGRVGVSGYRGVTNHKASPNKPWYARIKVSGVYIDLGVFADKIEAAKAYDAAAIKYHGEFARLNFPQGENNE
jgi:hypothetical protein